MSQHNKKRREEKRLMSNTISFTGIPSHHYFCVEPDTFMPVLRNEKGEIKVFLTRERANQELTKEYGVESTYIIVGMGDAKWELFKQNEMYQLIND